MPTATIQTPDQVRALFDQIAPHYDALNQVLSLGWHQIWKGIAVRWLDPPLGGQVLDLCCGSGDLAFELARRVGRQGGVVGLDFSAQLLAIAKRRGSLAYPSHHLSWIQGDALALPFDPQQFDGVTMGYGLRNVIDISQAWREMWRVLKPGARAVILDFQIPEDPWMRAFQAFYLQQVVVPMATRLGLKDQYAYILPSVTGFPDGIRLCQMAMEAGFATAKPLPLSGGLMGLVIAQKGSS